MGWIERGSRVCWRQPGVGRKSWTFASEYHAKKAVLELAHAKDDLDEAALYERVTGKKLAAPKQAAAGMTVRAWADEWLEAKHDLAGSTRSGYRRILDKKVLPAFGDKLLADLDGTEIAKLLDELRKQGMRKGTRAGCYAVIHAMLAAALKKKKVASNAAQWVEFDRYKPDKEDVRTEDEIRVFLTAEQFEMILAKMSSHYRPFITFLVETGVRFSEATALRIGDIDWDTRTIAINQNWMTHGVPPTIALPKSSQQRKFQVSQSLIELLKTAAGGRDDSELVFRTTRNKVIHQSNFNNRYWIPAVTAAGQCDEHPPQSPKMRSRCKCDTRLRTKRLPTPRHLRHSCASWLLTEGVPLEKISAQLGHSSTEITRKIYARFLKPVDYSAADTMDVVRGRTRTE